MTFQLKKHHVLFQIKYLYVFENTTSGNEGAIRILRNRFIVLINPVTNIINREK